MKKEKEILCRRGDFVCLIEPRISLKKVWNFSSLTMPDTRWKRKCFHAPEAKVRRQNASAALG